MSYQICYLSLLSLSSRTFVRCLSSSAAKHKFNFKHLNQEDSAEKILLPLRKDVSEQGNLVRILKQQKSSKDVLQKAIAELDAKKHILEQKEIELYPPIEPVDKAKLQNLLKQRFFYDQAFYIYGGRQGLYDFGPAGCAVQANLLREWRNFFVLAERMLEVDSPVLTPEPVLRASGHVAKFSDYLVSDSTTGESFRADHLVRRWLEERVLTAGREVSEQLRRAAQEALATVDSLDAGGLQNLIDSFAIKSPDTGNELTPARSFNLMLETSAGAPTAPQRLFLRPETAQGIFVNFRRLLEANHGRLPMSVAQVGRCFRNEIAPRSGLTRLREFTLAEIEHFYDPADPSHSSFSAISTLRLPLLSAADQSAGIHRATWRPLDASLASVGGPILHESLAYYLGRVFLFLTLRCGVDPRRLRFRQHPPGEMAHYARDCWDAECLVTLSGVGGSGDSHQWVECVGCADRSAYDLTRHAEASGVRLTAERRLRQRRVVDCAIEVDSRAVARAFGADASQVSSYLASVSQPDLLQLATRLNDSGATGVDCMVAGKTLRLLPGMLIMKQPATAATTAAAAAAMESIVPCVVEPSFGVGRIMAAALEHCFRSRPGDASGGRRTFLALPPRLAPHQCVLLSVSGASQAEASLVTRLAAQLTQAGIAHTVDTTPGASIGKRYARNDQLGIPFAVTVDAESAAEAEAAAAAAAGGRPVTVTLRDRDSMRQVRLEIDQVSDLLEQLLRDKITWQQVMENYPVYQHQLASK